MSVLYNADTLCFKCYHSDVSVLVQSSEEEVEKPILALKAIYIRLPDSTCLLVEVFLSDIIHVEVSGKMY